MLSVARECMEVSVTARTFPRISASNGVKRFYVERDPYHIRSVLQAALSMGSQNLVSMGDGSGVFQHAYGGKFLYIRCRQPIVIWEIEWLITSLQETSRICMSAR